MTLDGFLGAVYVQWCELYIGTDVASRLLKLFRRDILIAYDGHADPFKFAKELLETWKEAQR